MNLIALDTISMRAIVALMAFLLAGAAWAQPSPSDASEGDGGSVNAMCHVMPDEPVDPRFTAVYEGVSIGLCCRKCLTKFEADPGAYVANLPVSFLPQVHEDGDADRAAHDHNDAEGGTHDTHEHAHSHDTGARSILAVWIGKFHPASTHFPIGLLIGAGIAELGMIATGKAWFRHAAAFCLTLATIGAGITASFGWFNGGVTLWDADWIQAVHRWLGTGTAVMSLLSLILLARVARNPQPASRVTAHRAALFLAVIAVGATGFFGGALVYGINHFAY